MVGRDQVAVLCVLGADPDASALSGIWFAFWWVGSTSPSNLSKSRFMQKLQESWNLASPGTILGKSREKKFFLCLKVCISSLCEVPLRWHFQERTFLRTRRAGRLAGIWKKWPCHLVSIASTEIKPTVLTTSWNWPSAFPLILRTEMWWGNFPAVQISIVLGCNKIVATLFTVAISCSIIFREMGFTPSESQQNFNRGVWGWRLNSDLGV